MIHGLDTGFLVAAEVREHAEHADASSPRWRQVLSAGDAIAIAPQVIGGVPFMSSSPIPDSFAQPLDT